MKAELELQWGWLQAVGVQGWCAKQEVEYVFLRTLETFLAARGGLVVSIQAKLVSDAADRTLLYEIYFFCGLKGVCWEISLD